MNDDEKGNMWIDLGVVGRDMGKGGGGVLWLGYIYSQRTSNAPMLCRQTYPGSPNVITSSD